jgi:hypothetical protein
MRPADLAACLDLARRSNTPAPFRWPWQPRVVTAREHFDQAWHAASREEVEFDGSGYTLASYFLAQAAINRTADPFDSTHAEPLFQVFTAAFVALSPIELPALPHEQLAQFCESEWPRDAGAMCEAIEAADRFYRDGMSRVDGEHAVVFIIE